MDWRHLATFRNVRARRFILTLLVGEVNSEPVTLDKIPQEVIDAVLAMEDADFYKHNGINYRGTFRALIENVNAGGIAQGGSTITQQLVKQKLLSTEQNFGRKSTEAFYALRVEEKYTKDEILEHYLNIIYLGSGAYGVQAAAETYWGKDVSELGWEEAALLAGIIRNPTGYDPTLYAERSRDRRSVVVDRLLSEGYIDEAMAEQIRNAPIPAERQTPYDTKPTDYFIEEALSEILFDENSPFGDTIQDRSAAVYTGGLKIYTTFDLNAQTAALAARDEYEPDDPRNFQIALAAIDTHTGAVRAMVGGPGFTRDKFNLTTDGLRQPGSTMKTFVLAALFEQGYTPKDEVRADRPCEFENPGGTPNPYEVDTRYGGSGGVQSVAAVTRSSNNCSFVRLGQVATTDAVVEVAEKLGISTPLDSVLSLPLGVKEVHPMEMASAYASFANDGIYNKPYYVERIEDSQGNVLYQHKGDGTRAVSVQTARMIVETLESNVLGGTGTAARLGNGHFAAGK
ncbi:MAG: transglycosylase domain-containing protein, partial [Acidimicrobiales bacterium]